MEGFNETTKKSLVSMHNSLADKDGDGISNAVDCKPSDPNKQGVLNWVKSKVSGRDYDELERETTERKRKRAETRMQRQDIRYKEKSARLAQREELEKKRTTIRDIKYTRQKQDLGLRKENLDYQIKKDKSRPPMPSMFGGGSSTLGSSTAGPLPKIDPWDPLGVNKVKSDVVAVKRIKKKPKRRKSKGKRKKGKK